jgi:hypothetical protein
MPTWLSTLPTVAKGQGYDLKRTPATQPLDGIITCDDLVVTQTHYWGGRTIPCEGETCKACLAIVPARWHVYVTAMNPKTREHFIFECTLQAGEAFAEHSKAHGTLRGCFFRSSRPKMTPNGKVVIATKAADLTKISLPHAPDLKRALCTIWQVPAGPVEGLSVDQKTLLPKKNGKALKAMREQPFNAPDPASISDILHESRINLKFT